MKIVQPSVTLLEATPNPELLIERSGRACYRTEGRIAPESAPRFIRMLMAPDRGHESVLEHASASFLIVCDRGVSHELVRHRLASFSQESTRYCNYSKDKFGSEITVLRPSRIQATGRIFARWESSCEESERAYLAMLAEGAAPEEARSVLPTCLKTELAMSANFREWRHVLHLRLSPAAHPDARVIAGLLRDQLKVLAPAVFEEF
jgi:thymidylate synthase (FAD)